MKFQLLDQFTKDIYKYLNTRLNAYQEVDLFERCFSVLVGIKKNLEAAEGLRENDEREREQ